ncbi:MAG: hypothetical protein ACPGNV_08965 [Mangrovicoccus sp.]
MTNPVETSKLIQALLEDNPQITVVMATPAPGWLDAWWSGFTLFAAALSFCTVFLLLFWKRRALSQFIDNISEVSVGAVTMSTRQEVFDKVTAKVQKTAVAKASETLKISKMQERGVLRRAHKMQDLICGSLILWVDDRPSNNDLERLLLEQLGFMVIFATSNDQALERLHAGVEPDVILSDIARPVFDESSVWQRISNKRDQGMAADQILAEIIEEHRESEDAGVKIPGELSQLEINIPVIFYVTNLDHKKKAPNGAYGITNRPDDLLHLIMNALERQQ